MGVEGQKPLSSQMIRENPSEAWAIIKRGLNAALGAPECS
jgi:hypothetical protein